MASLRKLVGAESIPSSIGVLITTYVCWMIFYGLFWCPTKALPGPWHTRFSSLASKIAQLSGRGAKSVDELHSRYGPVVRVAPTVVSVLGDDAVRIIYGGNRLYSKDARLANLFSMCRPQHLNVAAIQDCSQAMKRRRVISTAFSTKFLADNEATFAEVAKELLEKIGRAKQCGNTGIDVLHTYRECATSVIVKIAFGSCFSSNAGNPVDLLDDALHAQFVYSLSRAVYYFMRLIPGLFPFMFGCDRLASIARESIENYTKDPNKVPGRKDALGPMLDAKEDGVDSTANSVTYATWELARNTNVQARARAELREAFGDKIDSVDSRTLQNLPYLNGCIAETLRLHAPLPGLPTRVVPKQGVSFHGYRVPGGISIGVQQYTIGRDPHRFPDPGTFDPTRWEIDSMTYHKELDKMMAFSYGPRICIGKNMALREIRHFLAVLLLTYDQIHPAAGTTADSMDEYEAGLTVPKSGKCILEFVKKS